MPSSHIALRTHAAAVRPRATMTGTSFDVEAAAKKRVKQARSALEKLVRRQARAIASGVQNDVARATRSLFTGYDAKLASLNDVVSRYSRKSGTWVPYTELLDCARTLSITSAPPEVITVYGIPKSKGNGFRVINDYGLIDSARQRLVQLGVTPLLKASDAQFGRAGRGRNEAVQRVASSITQYGHEWVVVCDLRSFFSSVCRDWLKDNLPVDEEVVASVILAEGDRTIIPHGHDHPSINISMEHLATLGRSGLPQGARTSSVVGTHVVASVLEEVRLPACVVLTVYVDDFVITAPSRSEALRAFDALRDAFSRHPAGTFAFSEAEPVRLSEGFIFLGYELSSAEGMVKIGIPARTSYLFTEKLFGFLEDASEGANNSLEFRRWFSGWWRAFTLAGGGHVEDVISDLELAGDLYSWQDPEVVWALEYIHRDRVDAG